MRFALLLRQRRLQSLMQLDPTAGSTLSSLASRIGPPLKRPASSVATALKTDDSRRPKHARYSPPVFVDRMQAPPTRPRGEQNTGSSRGGNRSSNSNAAQRSGRGGRGRLGSSARGVGKSTRATSNLPALSEPMADARFIKNKYANVVIPDAKGTGLGSGWEKGPKSALSNFMSTKLGHLPKYETETGILNGKKTLRVKVNVIDGVVGVGDSDNRKDGEKLASLAACYEIIATGLYKNMPSIQAADAAADVTLSDGSKVGYEKARQFMDYYCRKYDFGQPFVDLEETKGRRTQGWEAVMTVGGRRIGLGSAKSKKDAAKNCYLDVVAYLEKCDPALWKDFLEKAKTGKDLGLAPKVRLQMSSVLEDDIGDLVLQMKRSTLFRNAPEPSSTAHNVTSDEPSSSSIPYKPHADVLKAKSAELQERRKFYLSAAAHEGMRRTRQNLPVYSKAEDVLKHVEENEITILMAATGSGKTTQIPQLILDSYIDKNEGSKCNIFCTQPRRLAAISVAQRVAKERGEQVGKKGSIGYQVRFEAALPEENGSVTFCTIGVFLRRMQSALQRGHDRILDNVTHIIVDEVHERDIDTDLLLVVLKRLLEARRAKGNPVKVILMSATIDATLFQKYFPVADGKPASVIEVPGRSFPVQKHFLDEFLPTIIQQHKSARWVFSDEKVIKYINRELPNAAQLLPDSAILKRLAIKPDRDDELEIPYPLVGLTISHVLQNSDSGHVLVFLPGWEEIQAVQKLLTSSNSTQSFGLNFNDRKKFSIHVLHSSIPLAEQQVIFDPPPEGVRRIILSTNIAETSVTIPDVVYVVDTAKIKENRYDPERHISALVSAWVGTSNLNQRAGRAGRHRSGEYYGILGQQRVDNLHSHQMVEMKRMDLSNVVMHVKALDFPGMDVEDVLARTIEPPAIDRVVAAMTNLMMVGALDEKKNLTSLGRVLLQLPLDVQIGRLVLYGSFFKCLDSALTLAALLSSRDPFVSPPLVRKEAQKVKDTWCPPDFRSDALAGLRAFNAWYAYEKRGDYRGGSAFCGDNFLSKPTLMMAAKVKEHLVVSLAQTGILDISAGGQLSTFNRPTVVPRELNVNGDSLPMLAALIAIASQPKFAIRTGSMSYRTAQDKTTVMHPSSVNHTKRIGEPKSDFVEKQLFAYTEKRQNLSMLGQGSGQMSLMGCTRLDPMTYVLFGAYNLEAADCGLECDGWLPMTGKLSALDDVRRLKLLMEGCMLRVFEGLNNSTVQSIRQRRRQPPVATTAPGKYIPPFARQNRDNNEDESGDEEEDTLGKSHGALSDVETKDLSSFTQKIVDILDRYADEQRQTQSRYNSRPATPTLTPSMAPRALPGGDWRSGASTPLRYDSRPGTPSRLGRR